MPQYEYKAMNEAGQLSAGSLVAEDEASLADMLGAKGLFLTESRQVDAGAIRAPDAAKPEAVLITFGTSAQPQEVAIFNEQLAIMIRTDLPILETLTTLARQQKNPSFKSALEDITGCVRGGGAMAAAFARHPRIFDDVYISLLSAGEASGKMPEMLDRQCEYINFRIRIRDKAISTLIYPSLVLSASLTVVMFLVIFILPTFAEIFSQFDIKLPLSTRALLMLSSLIRAWWPVLLGALGAAGYFGWKTLSSTRNATALQVFLLDVPVMGGVIRNLAMTRIFKTMASLASSGIPILKSIELAKASAGNRVFAEALDRVHRSASEGHGLAPVMSESPFPEIVGGMIETGERSGSLPAVLVKLAAFYETQTNNSIQRFFSVLEPLFVAVLGMVVAAIAFSVLIPVFSLTQGF